MSGEARVKSPNILTGMILTKRGGANIAMKDARTDNLVFACNFHAWMMGRDRVISISAGPVSAPDI